MTYNYLHRMVEVMGAKDKSYAAALVTERTGREVPDLLHELYVERRHSQREIAEALGISHSAVATWLRRYGISRADRPPVSLP